MLCVGKKPDSAFWNRHIETVFRYCLEVFTEEAKCRNMALVHKVETSENVIVNPIPGPFLTEGIAVENLRIKQKTTRPKSDGFGASDGT